MSKRHGWMNARLAPLAALALIAATIGPAGAGESPALAELVKNGNLPPMAERMPANPRVVDVRSIGKHGGDLRIIMAKAGDTRMMTVYGYARLVGYDQGYNLVPDILESFDVQEGRIFTLRLRPGHKWSDGHPFTTEDFRYWWEDVANNPDLSPLGAPIFMKVDGQPPQVDIIDELTIRYTWQRPNPTFLPQLAGARPPFIYRPSH